MWRIVTPPDGSGNTSTTSNLHDRSESLARWRNAAATLAILSRFLRVTAAAGEPWTVRRRALTSTNTRTSPSSATMSISPYLLR
jgi:hypothetical protein